MTEHSDAIVSYGIICYHGKPQKVKSMKYLMIMRRNTFAYIEFVRAKYDLLDPEYIQRLFDNMTLYEKEMIKNNNFNYLWNRLWCIKNNSVGQRRNQSDFYRGIIKFNILKKGFFNVNDNIFYNTEKFINNCKTSYVKPEWYFPKGRKNFQEENIVCAMREFCEETNIPENMIELDDTMKPIIEEHTGTNNVKYRTILYPARYLKDNLPKLMMTTKNKFQKQEIGDVRWFSFEEGVSLFRDYEVEKRKTLVSFHKKITKSY